MDSITKELGCVKKRRFFQGTKASGTILEVEINHSLNAHITDTPLYEGNIRSKLKISFQARKSHLVKLSKNGSS